MADWLLTTALYTVRVDARLKRGSFMSILLLILSITYLSIYFVKRLQNHGFLAAQVRWQWQT